MEKKSSRMTWLKVAGAVAAVALIAAPVAQAKTQAVKVKGTVNTKVKNVVKTADSNGQTIESAAVPDMGLLGAPGSAGAVAVRNYAGGGGFWGTGDCNSTSGGIDRPNSTTVPSDANNIITGVILTGTDAKLAVTAPDLLPLIGPKAVANFRTDATTPNAFIGLGNGLTVSPSELVFTCTGWTDADGEGDYVILGQGDHLGE